MFAWILLLRGGLLAALGALVSGEACAACPPPATMAKERWAGEAEWTAIQQAGLRYGAIRIRVDNVYDLAAPREDVWYTRAANFLHVRTRKWVVDHLLLIQSGEPVNALQVYETIRRLRAQTFFRAANIVPIACTDASVTTEVVVRDAWTLNPDVRYAHAGGATQWRVELDDDNFLGTGRKLLIGHQQTLQRSINELEYVTPTLANSDWTMTALYQQLSDGKLESLAASKPFLLDTTPWGADVSVLNQHLDLDFYNDGVQAWLMPQHEQQFQGDWQKLLDFDGETAIRAGLAVDYEHYTYGAPVLVSPGVLAPPLAEPRTLAGVGPEFSLYQDRFASFENMQEIGRVEDYNLGWDVTAQVLYDATVLGATASGPDVSVTASKGFEPLRNWLVLADGSLSARRAAGIWRNQALTVEATAYGQPWRRQTLVVHVDYASLLHPDPENRLYIGGFQALRGYPNFFAIGTRRVRMTIADRIVTPMVWFHTVQVGFVVFNDDATIDRPASQGWSSWYSSVGGGLRFGNLRGSFAQILYLEVADPLRSGPGVVAGRPEIVAGDVLSF